MPRGVGRNPSPVIAASALFEVGGEDQRVIEVVAHRLQALFDTTMPPKTLARARGNSRAMRRSPSSRTIADDPRCTASAIPVHGGAMVGVDRLSSRAALAES